MKILLIGPVFPFKGGIAHYTGLMCKALSERHEVYMMSYKMQYPKILFKKEQRDYDNDTFKIDGTDYQINTANPFNWIISRHKIKTLKPDMIIVQWWHPYFAPCYLFTFAGMKKKYPITFVCHNVFPHERFPMDRFLTKITLRAGSSFIVQSKQDEEDLLSIKEEAKYIRTVHPTYNAFKIQNMTKEKGRELLSLEKKEKVLLFFGFVREYKGLKHLLRALPKVSEKYSDIKLLVVGDFGDDKDQYLSLIESLNINNKLEIFDGYIPDKEVEKFFVASDLVVLPYESATQSGIVQISYGFEKPVIATDVGGLPEVVINNKTGYIVPPKNPELLAERIIQFFEENNAEKFSEEIRREADKYSWSRMVDIIESLHQ